jgi:hypothetical protein
MQEALGGALPKDPQLGRAVLVLLVWQLASKGSSVAAGE